MSSMATSTRRQPLMSIPNATNSPHRTLNNSGSKRSRAIANVSQQENEPPSKRQAVENSSREPAPITPRRHNHHDSTGGEVFERGAGEQNTFHKKLVAARDRQAGQLRTTRGSAVTSKDVQSVRQWQKHYKKLFPTFSFYYDTVPDDVRIRFSKQAGHIGGREEKFFSNKVTHIITARDCTPEGIFAKALESGHGTIDPSMLEVKSGKSLIRRDGVNANDILVRGSQMGMKVWSIDKMSKVLNALLDDSPGQDHPPRQSKAARTNNDLVQVLRSEKLAAVAEKEQAAIPRELILFRGPFLYVHDMDEKVKPIMLREYARVARRQDGEWPQFRSASMGKCPFVEDPVMKKELERERAQQKAQQVQQQREARKTSTQSQSAQTSQTLIEPAKMDPPRRTSPRKALKDVPNNNIATVQQSSAKIPPPYGPERQSSFPSMPEQPPVEFVKPWQMHLAREPSASGIQRSAMTSAIQSQMISSAAATGMKATTSKEVNELKRKVLERTHTGSLSIGSISSSHQVNALAGALKNVRQPGPQRAAKSKAQEKLGGIQEEADPYADDLVERTSSQAVVKKKKPAKREPKPGYCENCHDKYDDFEDHVISRKHRKFAMTQSNWQELDALLAKLQAP